MHRVVIQKRNRKSVQSQSSVGPSDVERSHGVVWRGHPSIGRKIEASSFQPLFLVHLLRLCQCWALLRWNTRLGYKGSLQPLALQSSVIANRSPVSLFRTEVNLSSLTSCLSHRPSCHHTSPVRSLTCLVLASELTSSRACRS